MICLHGVLAQLEACVLSKDEVLGSKPRYSILSHLSYCDISFR